MSDDSIGCIAGIVLGASAVLAYQWYHNPPDPAIPDRPMFMAPSSVTDGETWTILPHTVTAPRDKRQGWIRVDKVKDKSGHSFELWRTDCTAESLQLLSIAAYDKDKKFVVQDDNPNAPVAYARPGSIAAAVLRDLCATNFDKPLAAVPLQKAPPEPEVVIPAPPGPPIKPSK